MCIRDRLRGYQGEEGTDQAGNKKIPESGIAGCLKHFAGYGAVSAGREYNDVEISQRTFREQYLKPFRMAMHADPAMVMTAFNAVDRRPVSGNTVSYTHLDVYKRQDDGFTTILTFEGGTEVLVEVGTNNYISLPRWYVLGEDGTAVIRDWQLNGEIIRKTGITEEKVVPVKTAAGLTKTMAPRREDTIVKEELPHVSGDIADFHRNVAAVIRDGAEPEIKFFQVIRVMKLMERCV